MTRHLSGFSALTVTAAVVLAFGIAPDAAAQRTQTGGDHQDEGGRSGGGDRGVAVPRGGGDSAPRGGGDSGGGRVSSGGGNSAPSSPRIAAEPSDRSGATAVSRRPREDRPASGRAIPRSDVPRSPVDTVIVTGGSYYDGYYPWGYGGIGLGGYYGSYDPWWYNPYYYGGGYGGGYYPTYEGRLRLKVKPSDAEVFVDGYYAGMVDEFDNVFQHLQIETGPHRIEIREDGYEPLTFEVRILPGRTVTYRGELKRNP